MKIDTIGKGGSNSKRTKRAAWQRCNIETLLLREGKEVDSQLFRDSTVPSWLAGLCLELALFHCLCLKWCNDVAMAIPMKIKK